MSASKSLLWLLNKLWLTLAILLVLAAVLMSALRYALPHIPDVSEQLEAELEARLQQPVEISSLAMSWHRQGPALDVTGITLAMQADSPIQVDVDRVSVVLDFWQSLLQRQLIAQEFILNQANIDVDLRAFQSQSQQQVNLDRFENLFLQQLERFSLTESEINVTNLAGNSRSVVIERLSWLNRGDKHQGVGRFRVRDFTPNSLDLIIHLDGNDLATVDGQLYVDSRQVDVGPWLEQQLSNVDITESNVNFTSWLTLVDGKISSGLLKLRDNRIKATVNNRKIALHVPTGEVSIEPQREGWLLNVRPMTLELNGRAVELPLIAWQSSPTQQRISLRQLPLNQLMPLWQVLPDEVDRSMQQSAINALQAPVDFWLEQQAGGDIFWHLQGKKIQNRDQQVLPEFSSLALTAAGKNMERGWWSIMADELTLTSDKLSKQPWLVENLDIGGRWQRSSDQWQLGIKNGLLTFHDLTLGLNGTVTQFSGEGPEAAMTMQSKQAFKVATASQLLPDVMGDGLKSYLGNALLEGQVKGLEIAWRGQFDQFPYEQNQGVFNARVDFDALDYKFQADWPALRDAPIRLDFYQSGLSIFSDSGSVKAVNVNRVAAQIPELTDAARGLQVDAAVSAPEGSLLPVFKASPLASVATTLRQVQPRSAVTGEFTLDVPFDGSKEVDVQVTSELAGAELYVAAIDQTFRVRKGRLAIDNTDLATNELILDWYGRPVTTDIIGGNNEGEYLLTVDTAIDWQLEPLLETLPSQGWQKYFYGAINGTGQLELSLAEEVQARWRSQYDLTGLESNLPAPLAKEFGENWQLTVAIDGNGDQLSLDARIADRFNWSSQWVPGASQWQSAQLVLGQQASQQKALLNQRRDAFVISAQVPHVNIGEWYDLIYFLQQSAATDADADAEPIAGPSLAPDYISVNTPMLTWTGQQFADAEIEIWPQDDGWFGRVYANDLSMEIEIPNDFIQQPIVVDADYIQLSSSFGVASPNSVREREDQWQWVRRLPAINVNCKTCKLDNKTFVDLAAELRPIDGGVELARLMTRSNNSELQASGYWLVDQGQPVTQISGNLASEDFGDLLRQYGLETAIRDSAATIDFGLNWRGHPHQMNFNSLGGSMQWQLGQGYLAEVSDGGARLFSLLSLDGILRKLTLDFRDIFSQGMFYTDLSGSVQLANGIATTNDTQLLGSAGNMEITGTTNLVTSELDYQLTYAPKVTSSLPVILAWMVNPPSGLAALLIDKVLQDAEVISQLRYHVSGTIDNPQVTEVERDSRPVDIPELDDAQEGAPNATNTDSGSTQ